MLLSNERMLEIRQVAADIDDPGRDYIARREREAAALRDLLTECERLRMAVPYTESDLMSLVQTIRRLGCPEHADEPYRKLQGPALLAWMRDESGANYTIEQGGELERRLRQAFLDGYRARRNALDAKIGEAVTEWRERMKR